MSDLLDTPQAGPAAVRGGVVRVAGYAAGVLLSVGSAALLFRHLGVAEAGRYVLVISIATIAVGLTDAGLSALGVREMVQRPAEERGPMLRSLLGLRLLLSLAGIAVACAYALAVGYSERLVLATALVGVAILVQGLQTIYGVALQAEMRMAAVAVADLIRQAAGVVAIVVLVAAGAGLIPFVAALIVAAAVGAAATGAFVRGRAPLWPSIDMARWRALLRLTLPFALATAVVTIYLRLGLLLVDQLADPIETGLYGVSFRVVEVLIAVPALMVSAAFPIFARAARDDPVRLRYALQRTFDASLLVGALIGVLFAVGAPVVVAVIGGAKYAAADDVLRWHALAIAGTFAAQPFGFALVAAGRTRAVLAMALAALVVCVAATIPLVQAYGAEGAAAAAAAAEWALAAAGFLLLRERVGLGGFARVAAASGVALLPMLVLPAVPAVLVAGLIFGALVLALRAVPDELMEMIRGAAGRRSKSP